MTTPLFLNMVRDNYETDFGLFNLVQSIKYKVFRPLFSSPQLPPIILVPGLGASKIYARWNKPDAESTAKFVDERGIFETPTAWNCRTLQPEFVPIWGTEEPSEEVAKYCLADNLHVIYNSETREVENAPGVTTYVGQGWDLATNCYNDFIKSLEAVGYQKDANLICAQYDFRRISGQVLKEYVMELKIMIERVVRESGMGVIIIGHSLGSQIANYFLTQMKKEWKDMHIKEFDIVSGTLGGVPKALRTLLSGSENTLDRETNRNFCGLLWMLPCPMLYGNLSLVTFRNVSYSANDMEQLFRLARYNETYEIYKNIHKLQVNGMNAPQVVVNIFSGNNIPTESNYEYTTSLNDPPLMESAEQNNMTWNNPQEMYPSNFNGDGTSPKFILEHPVQWSIYQKEPIRYFFYDGVGDDKILSKKESVSNILSTIIN